MGRRALPKLDPQVDVSGYLLDLEQLTVPLAIDRLFERSAELEIEVGSGKGLFLLNASEQNPERNFLGIELAAKYARFCGYRLAQRGRTNAKVIAGDGLKLFREYLPDATAAAIHVYFPDPWWKARHRKRRVMQESFIRDVHRVLRPGGVLHFWTDVEEYFESTCELIRSTVPLLGPRIVAEPLALHDMDYRTHFERRMRRNEQPVFRTEFGKLRVES